MADITNKQIDFLSNENLIRLLRNVLNEIDIVYVRGAHRSTTFLAVSAIEGLCREILKLLNVQPAEVKKAWPVDKRGKFVKQSDLRLEGVIKILFAVKALPQDFDTFYDNLRTYRNYIHPDPISEIENLRPIDQSIGQLAVACLNALIEKYKSVRFLARQRWILVYGLAQVPEDNVLHMPQNPGEDVSLLVSAKSAQEFRELNFRVVVPKDSIFNFVYSYKSSDNFMAARIEGRTRENGRGYDNGKLFCTKWSAWAVNQRYTVESEPDPNKREHIVRVVLKPKNRFAVIVDNVPLSLADGAKWGFDPKDKIGFMTEQGVVSIVDLELQI